MIYKSSFDLRKQIIMVFARSCEKSGPRVLSGKVILSIIGICVFVLAVGLDQLFQKISSVSAASFGVVIGLQYKPIFRQLQIAPLIPTLSAHGALHQDK